MKIETSFDHVWLARDHIDKIVCKTGAGIRCPDVSCLKELPKKYSIWIRGTMDAVFMANVMLNVSYCFSIVLKRAFIFARIYLMTVICFIDRVFCRCN